jgi:hypothetical protein
MSALCSTRATDCRPVRGLCSYCPAIQSISNSRPQPPLHDRQPGENFQGSLTQLGGIAVDAEGWDHGGIVVDLVAAELDRTSKSPASPRAVNCQIGTFSAYAPVPGHPPIDQELYPPQPGPGTGGAAGLRDQGSSASSHGRSR